MTSAGVKQITEFGSFFAEYYQEKIKLEESKVYAKSTNKDRTIVSAKSFLSGIFGNYNEIDVDIAESQLDNVIKSFFFYVLR